MKPELLEQLSKTHYLFTLNKKELSANRTTWNVLIDKTLCSELDFYVDSFINY